MHTRFTVIAGALLLVTGLALVAVAAPQKAAPIVVYKSPTCGCCGAWIQHLMARDFQVELHNVGDAQLTAVERESRVPEDLVSCHTAKVGGYIVEGHVPAEDIQRILREKPAIAGIAVAGMPIGSPGMEQGATKQPFTTMAFTKDGKKSVFARH